MTGIKALNILSLHGKGGNAITFERKLEPIVKHFKTHHFHFLDGPYILSKDRARLNTEKRDIGKNDDNITDRAWWTLPDGVRSFEATSYEGVEKSIEMIEEQIRTKKIDILVGHSQGAMIATIITARAILGQSNGINLKGSLMSSPAWPQPFDHLMQQLKNKKSDNNNDIITIHTIGKEDKVNPPAHSYKIADYFRQTTFVHLVEHAGGHVLPTDSEALSIYSKLFSIPHQIN